MKYNFFKRVLCFILTVAIVFSIFAIFAPANNGEVAFTVKCDAENTKCTLNLINVDDTWYVKATDLASLAKADAKQENNGIAFYKKSPYVFLYNVNTNNCKKYNSAYYVPLQSTSSKIGVRFYLHGNTPKAEVLRTPQQMLAEIKAVFSDSRLPLNQITSLGTYVIAENAARMWAMLPFVGSGSIVGTITGKDEYDRYREVITTMISDGGSISDFMATCADFDGEIKKYADVLGKAAKLTQKGSSLYNALLSKGISEDLLNALAYEYNPYEHDLGDFLKGYASVAKIIDIQYILDVFAYYAAVVDMDESTLLCMQKVFNNSSDKHTKKATQAAIDLRFGSGYVAMADIYSGAVGNIIINGIDKVLEEKLSGGLDDIIGVCTFVYDETLQISDKADALIYMSICASLQNDIINYYNTHTNESAYDMRAITIMYLKTTLVAYDYLEFDKGLKDTVEVAKRTINSYLDNIFGYADTEYSPNYDNSEIITCLNKNYNINTNIGGNDNSSSNTSKPEDTSIPEDTSKPEDNTSKPEVSEEDVSTDGAIVDSGKCGDNVVWQLDEFGTLTISGSGKMYDYKITSYSAGVQYTNVPWFRHRQNIKSIIIKGNITTIGAYAFFQCKDLDKAVMPNSVTTIGDSAFSGSNINSIIITDDENSNNEARASGYIGSNAFFFCPNLTSITIPNGVTSIGYQAFSNCTGLTSVTIPDSVTTIGNCAFDYCTSLTSVTIGNGVTTIGYNAFSICTSLTKVNIPDGVNIIPDRVFYDCSSLTEIIIPVSVTTIDDAAFMDCTSLTDVYYTGSESDWEKINISSFYNTRLTNAKIHYNS